MLKYVPKSCQVHAIAGLAPYQHFVRAIGDAIWDEVDLSRSIMQAVFLFAAASYEPYGDKIGYHSLPFSPGRHSDHMVGIPGFSNSYLRCNRIAGTSAPMSAKGIFFCSKYLWSRVSAVARSPSIFGNGVFQKFFVHELGRFTVTIRAVV